MSQAVLAVDHSAGAHVGDRPKQLVRRAASILLRIVLPVASVLALWYLAIFTSGLPSFVIPRPERVLQVLLTDTDYIGRNLFLTLQVATLGIVISNLTGLGLALLFLALPISRQALMPAALALRNVPFVAIAVVLSLAFGDSLVSKVSIVVLAGFFPVLVNSYRGLLSADPVVLDRMRLLNASMWEVFLKVRLPYALPFFIAAQEITCTGAIVVSITSEWLTSSSGLGAVIQRAMQQYRGDQVYAVSFVTALLSFAIYSTVHAIGRRVSWAPNDEGQRR
jgi:ABC-type nitrate/sulfonate/bicarbonate transport system permease component